MEKLNCELYGMTELTETEKKDTDGGTILLRGIVASAGFFIGLAYKWLIALPAYFFGAMGLGAY
jgi:hypothetical protein